MYPVAVAGIGFRFLGIRPVCGLRAASLPHKVGFHFWKQVETIVVSVISMLSDPTDESPANLDAAVCPSPLTCYRARTCGHLLRM